jgi:acyl-CoA synthetase (NDP forming)
LLNPRSIALIGASTDAKRLTARAQIYLRRHGYTGALYPVNPRATTVLDEPAFASVGDIPDQVDLAYILVGTQQVEASVAACAARGIAAACVLADGFAEAGAEGAALQARLVAVARAGGMRLLGPNSMGVINVHAATACCVNAALEAETLVAGGLSLVSQSGSVMGTLLSRAAARGFGFAKLIGTGNEADLTAGELVDLLADDPDTTTILLFLEAIRAPETLAAAVRRAQTNGKPVAAFMLGRSDAGAKLAVTHTGALAGAAAASEAFLREAGVARVDTLEALLEIAPLLRAGRPGSAPHRAVRVVTTTGGGGAMVVDRLGLAGIATAHMRDTTLAGADRDAVGQALSAARDADDADLAIAVIGSSAQFKPEDAVAGVLACAGRLPVCAFLAPEAPESLRVLASAGIAAFRTPESCADAVRAYMDWQTQIDRPGCGDLSAATALLGDASDEPGARAVFASLGLRNDAVRIDPDILPPLAYPVALKGVSAEIVHKTDEGAVALNLPDAAAVQAAAAAMRARLGSRLTGFIAQPMVRGVAEAIIGFRRDPAVGATIVLGAGGVLAEIYRDAVVRMAPVTEAEAMEMIHAVRGLAPVLDYRGLPRGDAAALARAVAAFSRLAGLAAVNDAEINPMIVMPEGQGVVMADAYLAAPPGD